MIRVIKSEWHQVEKRYGLVISRDDLENIYPDYEDNQIDELYNDILNDDADYDQLIEDSNEAEVYLDWEWLDEDDWWTDRKGGYDVTYSVESDYEAPVPDWLKIRQLEEENERLRKLIDGEPVTYEDEEGYEPYTEEGLAQALEQLKVDFDNLNVADEQQSKPKKSKKTVDKPKKSK
jgi:hypothetical protein